MPYLPIATKLLPGTDEATGLPRAIHVWKQTNDAKSESISVVYDLVTLLPNGKVASILRTDEYRRFNNGTNDKFDQLRASEAGQLITSLIAADLESITSFETIRQDLMQAEPLPPNENEEPINP